MVGSEKIFAGIDLKKAGDAGVLEEVERQFRAAWSGFGAEGNIGHHEKNLWYNVTVPFNGRADLDTNTEFAKKYRMALIKTSSAFALLLPYRMKTNKKIKEA